ncbi:restriction endonuclease, partial [Oenococcus oeni]
RFTNGSVGEPEIDRFKGVMDSFNAEYGIFITTSYFTDQAKEKAVVGNNSVTLIDGIKLASLVQKYQLRV